MLTMTGWVLKDAVFVRQRRRLRQRRRGLESMEAEIGDAAGVIWQYLDEHGVTTLSKLRQGTKLTDPLLLLGVGWLARERKLRLVREGRTVRVDLRERGPV